DLGIDPHAFRESPGSEASLLAAVHGAVLQRCSALGAAPVPGALPSLPCVGDDRPVVFAGFLAPSPRLKSIAAGRAHHGFETAYATTLAAPVLVSPRVVTPADEREELERIAEWCQRRLAAQTDARLLILLPGSAGRRERLAALLQQGFPGQSLVAIEGG